MVAVCHQFCLDTKLLSMGFSFLSLCHGDPVSSGCHWARPVFKELISVCDVRMVSRKHMEQKVTHIFPDDLELLLNSTSISNEC